MALSLRLLANVLLVVASSRSSSSLPTKASSNLVKLPNKVDAVASCSKTGLRKAVAEVRFDSMRVYAYTCMIIDQPGCQIARYR